MAFGNLGSVGGGGLIRNDQCVWFFGFSINFGCTISLVAELWAIWQGIQIAWNLDIKHLQVESDSLQAISLVQ